MKNKILITSIAAALLTFVVVPAIFAEDAKSELNTSDAAADGKFIDTATRCSLAEIKAGEIAKDKATREDVKDFAKMMVKDHTDVNKNLKALADKMNIELPKDPGTENQVWLQKITGASATEFDRTYIDAMVTDHRSAVKLFEEFARTTKNADLKAYANNTLPGLRAHLQKSLEWQKALAAR